MKTELKKNGNFQLLPILKRLTNCQNTDFNLSDQFQFTDDKLVIILHSQLQSQNLSILNGNQSSYTCGSCVFSSLSIVSCGRVLNLFWKHTASASVADLVNSITKIAGCYEPVHVSSSCRFPQLLLLVSFHYSWLLFLLRIGVTSTTDIVWLCRSFNLYGQNPVQKLKRKKISCILVPVLTPTQIFSTT